ncbi:MAG: xanthine dehydrogenase accessory protein XdhC [Proteobacteria bacterium]|nr:xanthine dehydrogenase accessory protein XdhC [Pseudomonadota bacterium]
MKTYINRLNDLIDENTPVVTVTLVDAKGSTPQDQGSKMLVTTEGLVFGTVGGGKVEKRSIEMAQEMLRPEYEGKTTQFVDWKLQKDVGMTCGGSVKLYFEALNCSNWEIVIFGAGHVANHLIPILAAMDCNITCIDMRQEWLDKLEDRINLRKIQTDVLESETGFIADNAYVLLMTQGHTFDRPVLQKLLLTKELPFIGVIGSKAKAKTVRMELKENGLDENLIDSFHCPIGLKIGSNHPQEIAISITAQLLQLRDEGTDRR